MNDEIGAVDLQAETSFEAFLEEEGCLDTADAIAIKRVVAWEVQQRMTAEHITKKEMAARMSTSRSQVDRLLDPNNTQVHLSTLTKAARAVHLRLRIGVEHEACA